MSKYSAFILCLILAVISASGQNIILPKYRVVIKNYNLETNSLEDLPSSDAIKVGCSDGNEQLKTISRKNGIDIYDGDCSLENLSFNGQNMICLTPLYFGYDTLDNGRNQIVMCNTSAISNDFYMKKIGDSIWSQLQELKVLANSFEVCVNSLKENIGHIYIQYNTSKITIVDSEEWDNCKFFLDKYPEIVLSFGFYYLDGFKDSIYNRADELKNFLVKKKGLNEKQLQFDISETSATDNVDKFVVMRIAILQEQEEEWQRISLKPSTLFKVYDKCWKFDSPEDAVKFIEVIKEKMMDPLLYIVVEVESWHNSDRSMQCVQQQSDAVRDYLIRQGINKTQIETVLYVDSYRSEMGGADKAVGQGTIRMISKSIEDYPCPFGTDAVKEEANMSYYKGLLSETLDSVTANGSTGENSNFDAKLSEVSYCWLQNLSSRTDASESEGEWYDAYHGYQDPQILFLMANSRTLKLMELAQEEWLKLLSQLNLDDKKLLYQILRDEFIQSNDSKYTKQENDYVHNFIDNVFNGKKTTHDIVITTSIPATVSNNTVDFEFSTTYPLKNYLVTINNGHGDVDLTNNVKGEELLFKVSNVNLKRGENTITITCMDKHNQKASKTVVVECTVDEYQDRKDRAVFFVESDYSNTKKSDGTAFCNLSHVEEEAESFKTQLEKYGFETEIVHNPTYKEFLKTLDDYNNEKHGQYDQLLVFYTGHGIVDGNWGYVVPSDYDKSEFNAISYNEIVMKLDAGKWNHVLFIVDACFSGKLFVREKGEVDMGYLKDNQAETMAYKTRLAISSANSNSRSPEKSKLVEILVNALSQNKDVVTYQDLIKGFNSSCYGPFEGNDSRSNFYFNRKKK